MAGHDEDWTEPARGLSLVDVDPVSAHGSTLDEADLEWMDPPVTRCVSTAVSTPLLAMAPPVKEISRSVSSQSYARPQESHDDAAVWVELASSEFTLSHVLSEMVPFASPLSPGRPETQKLDDSRFNQLFSGVQPEAHSQPTSKVVSASASPQLSSPQPSASSAVPYGDVGSLKSPAVASEASIPGRRARNRSPPALPAPPVLLSWSSVEISCSPDALMNQLTTSFQKINAEHSFDPSTWTVRPC